MQRDADTGSAGLSLLATSPDGSFVIAGPFGDEGELVRAELRAGGYVSVVAVHGRAWSELDVAVGRSIDLRDVVLTARSARSHDGGGIAATCVTASSRGQIQHRDLQVDADGKRRWTVEESRQDGARIYSEGGLSGGKATTSRRRLDPHGETVWEERTETAFEDAQGGSQRVTTTAANRTFPDGRAEETRRVAFRNGTGFVVRGFTNIELAADKFGGKESVTVTQNPDGSTTTVTTTTYPDGSQIVSTTRAFGDPNNPSAPFSLETVTEGFDSSGFSSGVITHLTQSSTPDDHGGVSGTSEITTAVDGGVITETHVFVTDASGIQSHTDIVTDPSGTETITTTTTDPTGGGTTTTTVTDSSGSSTTETTTFPGVDPGPVDPGSGPVDSGGGNGDGIGNGNGGNGGNGNGGNGNGFPDPGFWDGDCPFDGDRTQCPPKVKGAFEDQGSAGRTLPRETGRALDRLTDGTGAISGELGVGVRAALFGLGEDMRIVRIGAATEAAVRSVRPPAGGDCVDDPMTAVTYATALASGIVQTGAADPLAGIRALLACSRLAAAVKRCRRGEPVGTSKGRVGPVR